jgi:hypothetical protein
MVPKKKFQYMRVSCTLNDGIDLDEWGSDGWELVHVLRLGGTDGPTRYDYYFKRETETVNA